ncbi:MAG: hydantoinase B/oxoprolinase family protein [Acidimicrobiales bacterium]
MTTTEPRQLDLDPIMVEIFRTRLEAIGEEAGAAIENTAISPIVTETKDWSVSIFDATGTFIRGASAIPGHAGAAMHAVRCTIDRHGPSIVDGDVFIANDPHSDGGMHPQDVMVQRPVFFDGALVAWVAISAHMLDMGGMVPGSSATKATECYQEALRFPSVRLFRAGVECEDMWEVFRTNVRSFDLIEMDMRSLVIGGHVAQEKLKELLREIGLDAFRDWARMLDSTTGAEFRRRLAALEPGTYTSTGWAEVGDELYRFPCTLVVRDGSLLFDLTGAPPQIPHFVNSKPYIVRASLAPTLLNFVARDLPLTHSIFDAIDIETTPGTILDSRPPAPIGAAHMDCTLAVVSAAMYCVQLALAASSRSSLPLTAPLYDAQGTTRWSFVNADGQRVLFTLLDGVTGGSPAGVDRDGLDVVRDLAGRRSGLRTADVEVLESVYPVLFGRRGIGIGPEGGGRYRSGSGSAMTMEPHGVDLIEGNMTGTRGWCPMPGTAGGRPGARTSFGVRRGGGGRDELGMHATGVMLRAGDRFELTAASGGGFGDPLDRDPESVAADHVVGRFDAQQALEIFGVALRDGRIDHEETATRRAELLSRRLVEAKPAPVPPSPHEAEGEEATEDQPLFPGVVQRGRRAVSLHSGVTLAVAPSHWTEGCPVLEEPYASTGPVPLVLRSYLDPVTGHALHAELLPEGEGRSFATLPDRWTGS